MGGKELADRRSTITRIDRKRQWDATVGYLASAQKRKEHRIAPMLLALYPPPGTRQIDVLLQRINGAIAGREGAAGGAVVGPHYRVFERAERFYTAGVKRNRVSKSRVAGQWRATG